MIELDGTENKSRLGANALLAVSLAAAQAAASGGKAAAVPASGLPGQQSAAETGDARAHDEHHQWAARTRTTAWMCRSS